MVGPCVLYNPRRVQKIYIHNWFWPVPNRYIGMWCIDKSALILHSFHLVRWWRWLFFYYSVIIYYYDCHDVIITYGSFLIWGYPQLSSILKKNRISHEITFKPSDTTPACALLAPNLQPDRWSKEKWGRSLGIYRFNRV